MLKNLIEIAKQPRGPVPVKVLKAGLLAQVCLLLVPLLVVGFWPERAHAVFAFVFISWGIAVALWFDIREAGVQVEN